MPPPTYEKDSGGWNEYRRLVMANFDRQDEHLRHQDKLLEEIKATIDKQGAEMKSQQTALRTIKWTVALIGTIFGAIGSLIGFAITVWTAIKK